MNDTANHRSRMSPAPAGRQPRGMALLLVIIAMAVASILSVTFLASQSTSTGVNQNVRDHSHARMIAEAALTQTLRAMRDNPNWRTQRSSGQWIANASLAGGTYSIWGTNASGNLVNDPTQPVTMVAMANFQGASHTLRTTVTPYIPVQRRLLFVVPNPASLDAQDTTKKSLFETWGYLVTLISDSASQASFDTQVHRMDVVYIARSTSASSIGAKLHTAPIGVITENGGMHNRLLMATNAGLEYTSDRITVVNRVHYITQPLPEGDLVIASSPTGLLCTSGTLGADAIVMARRTGTATPNLVALEANGRLTDGDWSFGRRVLLPWAGASFDVRLLNANGLTIMRRSLDWASQPIVPRLPVAHWPLGEVTGNIAFDVAGTNHGTYQGNAWLGTPDAPMGNAVTFDGNNSYVLVPNAAVLNIRNAITITGWIHTDTWANGNHRILQKGNADNQYRLTGENGVLKWDLTGVGVISAAFPTINQWVHVAACYDGARMTLYYDGVLVASAARTGTITTTNDCLHIATKKVGAPASDSFIGMMCDVQVFDYGLSASEVHHIYSQGTLDEQNPTPKLVALYQFKETVDQPVLMHHWKLDENGGGGGIHAGESVKLSSQSIMLSYNSSLGPAAAGNMGAAAVLSTNSTSSGKLALEVYGNLSGDAYCGPGGSPSTVITVTGQAYISGIRSAMSSSVSVAAPAAPSGMPGTLGKVTITSNQTISSDRHYEDLFIQGAATVTITGNVRILCDKKLEMSDTAAIVIAPGSSLNLYVNDTLKLMDQAAINPDSSAVGRLRLFQRFDKELLLEDDSVVSGVVYSAGKATLKTRARLYGRLVVAKTLDMSGDTAMYADIAQASLGPAAPPASDVVGGFLGTYRGGVSGGQAGFGDGATSVLFNGSNSYVLVPHSNTMLLAEGSVSFWFNSSNLTGRRGLFSKDASTFANGGLLNIFTNANRLNATLKSNTTTFTLAPTNNLATNTWYHVTFTFGPGGMALYLNGSLVATNAYSGGLGSSSGGSGNREQLIVGADRSTCTTLTLTGLSGFFAGRIDDVRVYRNALDAAQVGRLFARQPIGQKVAPGLVVFDTSGSAGEPLNLYVPDISKVAWQTGGGLRIISSTKLASPVGPTKLKQLLSINRQMTLHMVFTPTNITQTGPAQLVTNSTGSTQANFGFGQSGSAYNMRLRTSSTTSSAGPLLSSPSVLVAGSSQQVIMVWDGTTMKIYRNGALEGTTARTGDLSTWATSFRMLMANEETGSQPWLGTLQRVALYDRAFNAAQLANVFADQPPGDGTGVERLAVQWNEQP